MKLEMEHFISGLKLAGVIYCLLFWGCSAGDRIHRSVELYADEIIIRETEYWNIATAQGKQPDSRPLAFEEAFCRAISASPEIRALELALKQADIDAAQAKSIVLPRISAGISVKAPIGASSIDPDNSLELGVYVNYDIIKAVFYKDAVAVEKALILTKAKQLSYEVKKIFHRLMRRNVEIDFALKQKSIRHDALSDAQKALARVQRFRLLSKKTMKVVQGWESEVIQHKSALKSAEMVLNLKHQGLQQILRRCPGEKINVIGWEKLIPDIAVFTDAWFEEGVKLDEVFKNRVEIQLKKLELFLAELGIEAAKRKKIPRIRASVGLGRIATDWSDNDTAPFVPEISVSMPLFDMGDVKRSIARAKIKRELAQEKLAAIAHGVVDQLYDARTGLEHADKRMNLAKETLAIASARIQAVEKLVSVNREEPIIFYAARIRAAKAQIAYLQGVRDLKLAVLNLQASLGEPTAEQIAHLLGFGGNRDTCEPFLKAMLW